MKFYNCLNCGTSVPGSHQKANKYCSIVCQHEYQYKSYIVEWKSGNESGNKGHGQISNHVRKYLYEKYNNTCCKCGVGHIWNKQPLKMEVEHKDGNPQNSVEDNLEIVCPNCHSQTPTYKNKNKGNGRYHRKERYSVGKSY